MLLSGEGAPLPRSTVSHPPQPPPVRSRYWGSLDPLLTMVREPILGSFRVGRVTLYCRCGQTDRQTRGKADDR